MANFEQTFKNIDDVLWKEAGCSSELDYTEQTSWMLFLKYLDDLEVERAMEAELRGQCGFERLFGLALEVRAGGQPFEARYAELAERQLVVRFRPDQFRNKQGEAHGKQAGVGNQKVYHSDFHRLPDN